MPRPGPRPYECVKRAWHSDRHQPIRGSLIQEMFRIVNEVHCPSTRKNKEWQEKLPIVVLKAEEIIYSKANSEAEYADLKTLWERVSDAIDTIIRRDDSAETGALLKPCIEAALHLGCTPRRSSRSQRNECPRYYLRPEQMEAATCVPAPGACGNHTTSTPHLHQYNQYLTKADDGSPNSFHSCLRTGGSSVLGRILNDSAPATNILVFLKNSIPNESQHHAPVQTTTSSSNAWLIYPLCDPKHGPLKPSSLHSSLYMGSDKLVQHQSPSSHDKGHNIECDLTLRLGSLVAPRTGDEHTVPLQVGVGNCHSNMLVGRKFVSHLKQ